MKILRSLTIILLLFLCSNCSTLDENPQGRLNSETIFNNVNDIESLVLGAYGLITSKELYGEDLTMLLLLRGDMCTTGDADDYQEELDDFTMDVYDPTVLSVWEQSYKVIGTANAAIHGMNLLEEEEKDATVLLELEAEARFIRGFMYYHLVRLFGNIPYIDFYIEDDEFNDKIKQLKESEVYVHILEDLTFAKANLPMIQNSNKQEDTRTRATKGTAAAFLASVHLTNGNFSEAYEEANWVIEREEEFDYEIMKEFQDVYDSGEARWLEEFILAFDFLGDEDGDDGVNEDYLPTLLGIKGTDAHADGEGRSVAVPSMEVYESWDDLEARLEVSLEVGVEDDDDDDITIPYTDFEEVQRPHIAKYSRTEFIGDNDDGNITDNNYAAIRYGELVLIAAEAANELGELETAKKLVSCIRNRAEDELEFSGDCDLVDFPSDLNQATMRDLIYEERRLELAFEFKRWYDIKRLRIGEEVFVTGENKLEEQDFQDHHYLLPIPNREISKSGGVLVQNPGY